MKDILKETNLKYDEFIEWCCLLGSDYCKGVIDLKYYNILEVYQKFKNISEVIDFCRDKSLRCSEVNEYLKVVDYFHNPIIKEVKNKDIVYRKCNLKKLENFMVKQFGFSKTKLLNKLYYLKDRNRFIKIKNRY